MDFSSLLHELVTKIVKMNYRINLNMLCVYECFEFTKVILNSFYFISCFVILRFLYLNLTQSVFQSFSR